MFIFKTVVGREVMKNLAGVSKLSAVLLAIPLYYPFCNDLRIAKVILSTIQYSPEQRAVLYAVSSTSNLI